jgi:hypothetical protein
MASHAASSFVGQRLYGGAATTLARRSSTLVRAAISEPEQKNPGYLQKKKEQEAKIFTRKPLKKIKSPTPSDIEIAQARGGAFITRRSGSHHPTPYDRSLARIHRTEMPQKSSQLNPHLTGYFSGFFFIDRRLRTKTLGQAAVPNKIKFVAEACGLTEDDYELYGKYKAKINLDVRDTLKHRGAGYYVVVAGITPTPLGEVGL